MINKVLFSIFLFSVITSRTYSQRISAGDCPKVTVKQNFDVNKYMGKWYEYQKNPTSFEKGQKCIYAVYEYKGDYVSVLNTGFNISANVRTSLKGKATIPDPKVASKLKVQFESMPVAGDYWVIDTDYDKYSIVYSCFSVLDIFKGEFLWILSRTKELDKESTEKVLGIMKDNGISQEGLIPTVQDCSS